MSAESLRRPLGLAFAPLYDFFLVKVWKHAS